MSAQRLSRAHIVRTITEAYRQLSQLYARHAGFGPDHLDRAYREALRDERVHRRMGAHFRTTSPRVSTDLAARYFVARAVLEYAPLAWGLSWRGAAEVRADVLYGRAAAEVLWEHDSSLMRAWVDHWRAEFECIHYDKHLA